jgi:hypothetical protein
MNQLPDGLDPERLIQIVATVHSQVCAALWLSAGMILATAMTVCVALDRRRTALALGLGYSTSLCFIQNGHAQVLGPLGVAVSLAGFLWRSPGFRRAGQD